MGQKLYGMASGTIVGFDNDEPNKPGVKVETQNVGGNYFKISHGDIVAKYSHMQKGSLNPELLTIGASVAKGQFLGLVGNSGNSGGPYLHLHKTKKTDGGFRPLLFENGYVIGTKNYEEPYSNVNWSTLKKQGIPGFAGDKSLIYPGRKHPYCKYSKNLKQIGKHGIPESKYQAEVDKITTCGFYPYWIDAYDVKGKTFFNVIFRPGTGAAWKTRHGMSSNGYQKRFDKFKKAGYRLTLVDSYISKGKVRGHLDKITRAFDSHIS